MAEPEDFSKLSLEDKLAHKVWKARLMGYEEATKQFRRIDDENSPEYGKFLGIVRKFPVEANAMAQEKALEATLAFTECAGVAGKICSEVIAGIVTKCLNARAKTKDSGINVCLMYIEIEKQDTVVEEIMKGLSNKQPKIVAACISVLRRGIQEFGARVFNIKQLLKSIPGMFEHSDKTVRAEAKLLAIEMYRWIGAALKTSLDGKIKPVQMKELEDEFSKLPGDPPVPTRLLRSQQEATPNEVSVTTTESSVGAVVTMVPEPIDPYELFEPVDMISKMPKDFYEKMEDTKWKERKEALESILPLSQSPKLEGGDYGELVKVLKKIIVKDSNVLVVALAGNVITGLAKGLRKKFSPYASVCLSGIFEKFKEKKLNVVTALREASDAIYLTTSLANIQDECVEALNSKNPSVKAETLQFLSRCYCQCSPAMLPKPYLKTMCPIIIQRLDDTTPQVRDATCEVLGTLLKALGERPMIAYLENIDKTKTAKINEFKDKVEMKVTVVSVPPPVKSGPTKQLVSEAPTGNDSSVKSEVSKPMKKKPQKKPPKKVVEDTTLTKDDEPKSKKPPQKKVSSKSTGSKGKGGAVGNLEGPPDVAEPNITTEEVEEKAGEVLPPGLLDQLAVTAWKDRLAAHVQFKEFVEALPPDEMQSLLFIKVLNRKPGWKDSNFQVMNAKFAIISVLAEKSAIFGKKSLSCALPGLVDKFADIKVKGQSADTLFIIAERMTLNYTSLQVLKHAFEQKSPKVHSESLEWLCRGTKEFGFVLNVKPHVDFIKKGFSATNPAVRTAAINLLATLHMYLGAQLRMFFEDEKPALLQQIDAAFEKSSGETPPAPIRGPNVRSGNNVEDEEGEDDDEAAPMSLADLMPKVDITGQLKSDLIKELGDKNWKIRGESLQKIQDIISQAKFIQPSLGDLPSALKGRLADSNKNLVVTSLNIIGSLATAMGSSCSKFNKVFVPGILSTLADGKSQVRSAAITCLNSWVSEVPLSMLLEQDLVSGALNNENPNLRTDLLGWLEEKLPSCSKLPTETQTLVNPLFICLEDRSAEVRKKAQALIPLLMVHVGYDFMLKVSGKLKPASRQLIKALLEKHRPSVEAVSIPKTSSKTKSSKEPQESVAPTGKAVTSKKSVTKGPVKGRKTVGVTKKGDDDNEGPYLILITNGKEQRIKDEEKLKILKWNFQMPRPEHIDQLKDQLLNCVSFSLHKKLFHEDFKQQLSAISTLTQCISDPQYLEPTVGCCDLLLRWVTLKFFDTNTTVNIKCLELLHVLFQTLTSVEYRMNDYEAGAFLPYLVIKVGDPKDPVRKEVRALFRELCSFYPPGKIFGFVIDGLKSKNARQRMECLETLGELIRNNGMLVCQPTPQKTVPLIAAQITDRDNAVRSAALNAMVVVYCNTGDGVYKFTSQLSEKDLSLLEERIRRSGKKQQETIKETIPVVVTSTPEPSIEVVTPVDDNIIEEERTQQSSPPLPALRTQESSPPLPTSSAVSSQPRSQLPTFTGPFKIDLERYKPPKLNYTKPKRVNVDMSCFEGDDSIPIVPSLELIRNPPKRIQMSPPCRRSTTSFAILYIISQISSTKSETCDQSLSQIESLICSPEQHTELKKHVDQLLRTVLMQTRMNFTSNINEAVTPEDKQRVLTLSQSLARVLDKVFEHKELAMEVRPDTLVELQRDIFGYLIDERLTCLEDIAQLYRAYNVIMGKVVDNTNRNAIFGSLLQVMLETLNKDGTNTKLSEMAMKCLWRVIRNLPDIIPSLNIDQLLFDIDKFLIVYSTLNPAPSSDNKPYRTVRTILYHIANVMGPQVLQHFSLVSNSSLVVGFLQKFIAKKQRGVGVEATTGSHVTPQTSHVTKIEKKEVKPERKFQLTPLLRCEVPRDKAREIEVIFDMIKDKSRRKEGIIALYDFKESTPTDVVDIMACLVNTHPCFQEWIKEGLKSVRKMRESGSDVLDDFGDDVVLTELRQNLETIKRATSELMDINWNQLTKSSSTNEEVSTKDDTPKSHIIDLPIKKSEKDIGPEEGVSLHSSDVKPTGAVKLEELRKRLDILKAAGNT